MHVDSLYPSRFLRCADLNGKAMPVRIAGITREEIGGEPKVIMTFTDGGKQLILNKTNARAIARIHGKETRDWKGKEILLVPAVVDFKSDSVDAIRVKPAMTQTAGNGEPPPFDDELDDFRA